MPAVSPPEFSVGDLVQDRDDDNPDEAVVVNTPPVTAEEWEVPAIQTTVAEDNPDYPADAPVVVVVFRDQLTEHFPDWTARDETYSMDELNDAGVTHYSFPAPRLRPAEDASPEESQTIVAMDDLKARLDDADWDAELEDDTLTVAKMGEQYRIHATGEVDGEGEIREPLETIVDNYTE